MKWNYSWETSSWRTRTASQDFGIVYGLPREILNNKGLQVDAFVDHGRIEAIVGSDYGVYYLEPMDQAAKEFCLGGFRRII